MRCDSPNSKYALGRSWRGLLRTDLNGRVRVGCEVARPVRDARLACVAGEDDPAVSVAQIPQRNQAWLPAHGPRAGQEQQRGTLAQGSNGTSMRTELGDNLLIAWVGRRRTYSLDSGLCCVKHTQPQQVEVRPPVHLVSDHARVALPQVV
jgi:hypothetical protein